MYLYLANFNLMIFLFIQFSNQPLIINTYLNISICLCSIHSKHSFEEYIKHTYKISTEEFNYRCNLSKRGFWYHHWLAKVGFFTANVSSKQFFHITKFYKLIQLHFYVSKSPKVQVKLLPKTVR